MKTKRITALVTAAVIAISAFAGCGSNTDGDKQTGNDNAASTSQGDKTELTFWTLNTRQNAVDPIVEEFNNANDNIQITVSYYDTDGIKDACKVAASSKTLPSMWFNWGGSLASFYVENGLTYDLTEFAKENGWNDEFNAGALDLCTIQDQLAGYPTSYNAIGMYYRSDIFEQYNIEVPETFEEFETACDTLLENGITPISTAGLNGWHVMRFVELLVEHYAGAELHDKLNTFEASWDCEEVVQALAKYKEACDKGYFPTGFLTADPNDTLMAVASGQAAMDVQGQWYDGKILQDGLEIENYKTFAFPSGENNRMSAFAEMTQFNKNLTDEELEAAVSFMDFYYSKENVDTYGEYYNLPLPKQDAEMPAGQPNVEILLNTSDENGIFTITDQAFPTEVADVLFAVQDGIANGEITPEAGAKDIQEAIETYKNK